MTLAHLGKELLQNIQRAVILGCDVLIVTQNLWCSMSDYVFGMSLYCLIGIRTVINQSCFFDIQSTGYAL